MTARLHPDDIAAIVTGVVEALASIVRSRSTSPVEIGDLPQEARCDNTESESMDPTQNPTETGESSSYEQTAREVLRRLRAKPLAKRFARPSKPRLRRAQ